MKASVQTPNSVKSSSTMDDGCRRDANCICEICLHSIKSTLDLLPISVHRSPLTKLSASSKTPVSFSPSTPSTPKSGLTVSPPLLRTSFQRKIRRNNIEFAYGLMKMRWVLLLCSILIGEFGFSLVISTVLETKLSPEIIRCLSHKSLGFQDFKQRLEFLNKELQTLVGARVSANPNWEIVRDGLMLRSRCQLYKSGTEEVSIWGWPLQTAGLLTSEFSSRSFTILSGRVSEWSNGELSYSIRKTNTSWEQGKWSASVLHLDQNTWILEYKRSFVFDNRRPFSSAIELLKLRAFQRMNQFWKISTCFGKQYSDFVEGHGHHIIPT